MTSVCPVPVNSAIIIAGIVVGIILIGLLLLIIWRILTYIHDSREYARFEKDRAKAKWDQVRKINVSDFYIVP